MTMNNSMKGMFWNCRRIRKKGLAHYIRDMIKEQKFDFLCFQETMVKDFSDSCFRQVDPDREYLWDRSLAIGKSGGLLSGLKVDIFDVESRFQGDFVLQHNLWDKK
jgi:exonuclease III